MLHEQSAADEIARRLQGASVAISNKAPIDAATLRQCPDLKLILVTATGTNNIDLAAARAQGVVVSNCQGYGTPSVAQHTLMLLLALATRPEGPALFDEVVLSAFHHARSETLTRAAQVITTLGDGWMVVVVTTTLTLLLLVRGARREGLYLAGTAIGAILAETRTRPRRTGVLATPLHKDEVQSSLRERPA